MKDHIRVITAISSEINPAGPAGRIAHYPPSLFPPLSPLSRTGSSVVM